MIRLRYPGHGFLTEEEDSSLPQDRPVTWIIDPVDGTSNFSRQISNFSISIAVAKGDQVLVGVIYDPMRDELFSAAQSPGQHVQPAAAHGQRDRPHERWRAYLASIGPARRRSVRR